MKAFYELSEKAQNNACNNAKQDYINNTIEYMISDGEIFEIIKNVNDPRGFWDVYLSAALTYQFDFDMNDCTFNTLDYTLIIDLNTLFMPEMSVNTDEIIAIERWKANRDAIYSLNFYDQIYTNLPANVIDEREALAQDISDILSNIDDLIVKTVQNWLYWDFSNDLWDYLYSDDEQIYDENGEIV